MAVALRGLPTMRSCERLRPRATTLAIALELKLQTCLKRDHARGTVAAQPDAE